MNRPPLRPSAEAWQWLETRPRKWRESGWSTGSVWSMKGLRDHYGDEVVHVSDTLHTDTPTWTRFDKFLDYCLEGPYPRPKYLHWWFGPVAPKLTLGLNLPWYLRCWFSRLPVSLDPELRWVLAGPTGSGTWWHTDFFQTTAWCHLLAGTKAWELRIPGGRESETSSWVQQAGETVYVPSDWPHRVENLEPTLALSGNILNPVNWRSVLRAVEVERPTWAPIVLHLAERFA